MSALLTQLQPIGVTLPTYRWTPSYLSVSPVLPIGAALPTYRCRPSYLSVSPFLPIGGPLPTYRCHPSYLSVSADTDPSDGRHRPLWRPKPPNLVHFERFSGQKCRTCLRADCCRPRQGSKK